MARKLGWAKIAGARKLRWVRYLIRMSISYGWKMLIFKIHLLGGVWHLAELTMNEWVYFDTGIIWEGGSWCFEFSFWYQIRSSTSKGWKMSIFKIHLSGGLWQPAELTMNKWAYFDTGIIWEGGSWCFEFSFWYQIRSSTSKGWKMLIFKIHRTGGVWHLPDRTMNEWVYFDTGITWEGGFWCFEFSFW